MTTRFWIKFYIGTLDDPKVARLPDDLWRRHVEFCLLAGREGNDGALPPVEEMAWTLRLPEGKVLEDLKSLEEAGVVGWIEPAKWIVTDFAKQQAAVPVDERMKQYRERKGSQDVTNRNQRCNGGGVEDSNSTSTSDSESESLEEETPSAFGTSPISSTEMGEEIPCALAGSQPISPKERGQARSEMGEEVMPRTPGEAMDDPDMQVFEAVTGGRIPGIAQYRGVIEAVRLIRKREKLNGDGLRAYLEPFWLAWSTRKRRDGRPYDPGNITWLVEWALNGSIPGGSKNPEAARPAIASPEETRRMLADKEEILKQAAPMPEEVRAKLRGLRLKMAGKESP